MEKIHDAKTFNLGYAITPGGFADGTYAFVFSLSHNAHLRRALTLLSSCLTLFLRFCLPASRVRIFSHRQHFQPPPIKHHRQAPTLLPVSAYNYVRIRRAVRQAVTLYKASRYKLQGEPSKASR
jgi:hypothetical protein